MNLKSKMYWIVVLIFIIIASSCGKKKQANRKFEDIVKKETSGKTYSPEEKQEKTTQTEQKKSPPQKTVIEQPKTEIKETIPEKPKKVKKIYKTETKKEMTVTELWNGYKQEKEKLNKAKEKGNFKEIISSLEAAADYAKKLKRNDIAAWQLNNIGYYSIEEFKKRTDYSNRIYRLNKMKSGQEKKDYFSQTKKILNANFSILRTANYSLLEAQQLDKDFDDEKRTKIIKSNLDFVNEIKRLIK